ncbi:hypothetical protein HKBW3S33_00877 [Candidatus Hakubella thermalkaliphila]|uniref:Uncharacterized protein n=1 Tax=Candidatus Hakubella thermalkaliphila TaxID=2754717 RepID=A0A6V8P749_9ACTN|nr:hypothetical protein HKBW3S33_00877 [Candidatus Hakubella thermalkaliphila]
MQGKMTSLTTGRLTGLRKSSLFFSALEGNSLRVGSLKQGHDAVVQV